MKTKITFLTLTIMLVSTFAFSQQTVYMDLGNFGDKWISPAPYNNTTGYPQHADDTNVVMLKNDKGVATGFKFSITQGFEYFLGDGPGQGAGDGVVLEGDAANLETLASMDCFYTKASHRGVGIITLSGLDDNKFYSFELFTSYFKAPDGENREDMITISGSNAEVGYSNHNKNKSLTVHVNDVKPKGGVITIQLEKGPNNESAYAVLNLFIMQETDAALAMEEALLEENGLNIYPNPVGEILNIDFKLRKGGVSSVYVYDSTGRMVYNTINNDNRSGVYTFKWNRTGNDGERLVPGTYFLKLETTDGSYTKKLILK